MMKKTFMIAAFAAMSLSSCSGSGGGMPEAPVVVSDASSNMPEPLVLKFKHGAYLHSISANDMKVMKDILISAKSSGGAVHVMGYASNKCDKATGKACDRVNEKYAVLRADVMCRMAKKILKDDSMMSKVKLMGCMSGGANDHDHVNKVVDVCLQKSDDKGNTAEWRKAALSVMPMKCDGCHHPSQSTMKSAMKSVKEKVASIKDKMMSDKK